MAEQTLIIGYNTAIEFWRAARVASSSLQEPETVGRTYGRLPQTPTSLARRAIELLGAEAPIDVVAPKVGARMKSPLIRAHSCAAPLPANSLFYIDDDIAVCRMPAVLVQLARGSTPVELARIAYEMTGTYGFEAGNRSDVVQDLRPLLDLGELKGYARSCRATGTRGSRIAADALRCVVPNSNSPRETDVAIILMMLRSMGGFDLPGFAMNPTIRLSSHLEAIVGSDTLTPDFYWPDRKVILEYESEKYHRTPAAMNRDERRRRAFESEGYRVMRLMNDVLKTNDELNSFMTQLAQALGIYRRPASQRMLDRRRQLREELFGPVSEETAKHEMEHPYTGPVI